MPVPAMTHAMIAPRAPVAPSKRCRQREDAGANHRPDHERDQRAARKRPIGLVRRRSHDRKWPSYRRCAGRDRQRWSRNASHPWTQPPGPVTLETAFPSAHQGFFCRGRGRKSACRISPRRLSSGLCEGGRGALLAARWRSGNGGLRDKNEARAEHPPAFASSAAMRRAWRTAASWSAVLASGPVGKRGRICRRCGRSSACGRIRPERWRPPVTNA